MLPNASHTLLPPAKAVEKTSIAILLLYKKLKTYTVKETEKKKRDRDCIRLMGPR
jgi:hypothetical protein